MDQLLSLSFDDAGAEQVRARFRCAGESSLMLGLQAVLIERQRQREEQMDPDAPVTGERNVNRSLK